MTVSEIALAGRPAVFVPYPFHRDRQQEHNARVLARVGGAMIVPDDERLGENLARMLQRLSARPECLQAMGRRAHQASIDGAAARIASLCFQIADTGSDTSQGAAEPNASLLTQRSRANESVRCIQEKAAAGVRKEEGPAA